MARHSRLEVLTAMKRTGLVPVFYNSDFETAKNIVAACADGGAECVEFTNRGDRAVNIAFQKKNLHRTHILHRHNAKVKDIVTHAGACRVKYARFFLDLNTPDHFPVTLFKTS